MIGVRKVLDGFVRMERKRSMDAEAFLNTSLESAMVLCPLPQARRQAWGFPPFLPQTFRGEPKLYLHCRQHGNQSVHLAVKVRIVKIC